MRVRSDNGSPFQSKEFSDYARFMGFEHDPVTPVYPKANGLVENFNKNIVKVDRTATVERKNLKQQLCAFLRSYRATPHTTTGKSPAELMFQKRPFRVRMPKVSPEYNDKDVRDRDEAQKLKEKEGADKKKYVKWSNIQQGDLVLVRSNSKRKMDPVYEPLPYTVQSKNGSTITAVREHPRHVIKRNVSFFKKLEVQSAVREHSRCANKGNVSFSKKPVVQKTVQVGQSDNDLVFGDFDEDFAEEDQESDQDDAEEDQESDQESAVGAEEDQDSDQESAVGAEEDQDSDQETDRDDAVVGGEDQESEEEGEGVPVMEDEMRTSRYGRKIQPPPYLKKHYDLKAE